MWKFDFEQMWKLLVRAGRMNDYLVVSGPQVVQKDTSLSDKTKIQ